MTEQEAIKQIRKNIALISDLDCTEYEMAISALEKQEKQPPIYESDGYADGALVYDTWICPNCDEHYEVDYDHYEHCPNCGQAIDWSDQGNKMEDKNRTETMAGIPAMVCDDYCRYPVLIKDPEELEERCENCGLRELFEMLLDGENQQNKTDKGR